MITAPGLSRRQAKGERNFAAALVGRLSSFGWSRPRRHIGRGPKRFWRHFFRFFWSPHCRDLAIIGMGSVAAGGVLIYILGYEALCWNWLVSHNLVDKKHAIPIDLTLGIVGGALAIFAWSYQSANIRFGIADLFTAEIGTLCRVAATSEFARRYVELYRTRSKFPSVNPSRDYFAAFNNNAKDLESLDGDVVGFVTQFYVCMKAVEDTLGRASDPSAGFDQWRQNALNIIYNIFLAFEAARQALSVLVDDRKERKRYLLIAMLSEIPAYLLLVEQICYVASVDGLRAARLIQRIDTYERIIVGIRHDRREAVPEFIAEIINMWDAKNVDAYRQLYTTRVVTASDALAKSREDRS
jgi:hypothetical protein